MDAREDALCRLVELLGVLSVLGAFGDENAADMKRVGKVVNTTECHCLGRRSVRYGQEFAQESTGCFVKRSQGQDPDGFLRVDDVLRGFCRCSGLDQKLHGRLCGTFVGNQCFVYFIVSHCLYSLLVQALNDMLRSVHCHRCGRDWCSVHGKVGRSAALGLRSVTPFP